MNRPRQSIEFWDDQPIAAPEGGQRLIDNPA
jgi:hypothetical protein